MPEQPRHDRIVVFSNGIADHQRVFRVSAVEPRRIALPVRRDHLADVLASLNVFGDVALVAPPSFQPSDVDAGNLEIDTNDTLEGLATSLAGSRVEVERPNGTVRGTLLGLHREPRGTAGEPIAPASLVVLTETGLRTLPLAEITNLQFEDEAVRDEIAKALKRNFQRINPHSTFVELELAVGTNVDDEAETEAIVQYTLPAAAWKMTYRLRERDDGRYELQGFAVVTNDTDDDWRDVLVSVVTGEPITFGTDLAETKIPRRKHVDVVRGEALGSVEVQESVDSMLMEFADEDVALAAPVAAKFGMQDRSFRRSAIQESSGPPRVSATTSETTAKDVGDFCVFEATTPVTIAARRSAAIPMFLVTLDESKTVLHYRHANHPERPFRAVDFTNRTTYSLGRGVCTVYQQGTYAGSCVLPALKPGEDRLLPHALETGVHVRREEQPGKDTVVGLHLSEGVCRTSSHQERTTILHLRSHRDEAYRLVLDHDRHFPDGILAATLHDGEQTQPLEPKSQREEGPRYDLTIPPRAEIAVRLVETRVLHSQVHLLYAGGTNVDWLRLNLVATNGPLAEHPGIRRCLEIQTRLDAKRREVEEVVSRSEQLNARQERLRENARAVGEGEQAARWRADLAAAEDRLVEIEETTLPALKAERDAIEEELRTALQSLDAEWSA